jgi:hypothetical protein
MNLHSFNISRITLIIVSAICILFVNSPSIALAREKVELGLKCQLIKEKFKVDEVTKDKHAELIKREIRQTRYHLLEKSEDDSSTPYWFSIDETKYKDAGEYGFRRRYLFVEPMKYRQFNDGPEIPLMAITRDTLILSNVYILVDGTRSDQQYVAGQYQCSLIDPSVFFMKAKEAADLFRKRQKI